MSVTPRARSETSVRPIAQLLKAQGDLEGAAPLMREALHTSREVLGPNHQKTNKYREILRGMERDM